MTTIYHVSPLPGGRWQVRQEGGASAVYDRKQEAVTAAAEMARAAAPGAIKIHEPDGTVETRMMGERGEPSTRR